MNVPAKTPVNTFKQALRAGQPQIGLWVSLAEAYVAELLARNVAVVLISSELPELLGLAHRVVVLKDGAVTGTLEGADLDEETIMAYATGLRRDPPPTPREAHHVGA